MKVSRSSWHYKFITYNGFNTYTTTNLCGYFWLLVWSILFYLSTRFVLAWVFVGPYISYLTGDIGYSVITIAVAIMGGVVVLGHLTDYLTNKYTQQEPNILLEYLKAKKKKVCPLIFFTD